jgi:hypothetical protein
MFGMFTTPAEGHAARYPESALDGAGSATAALRVCRTACRRACSAPRRLHARARDVRRWHQRWDGPGRCRPRQHESAQGRLDRRRVYRMHRGSAPMSRSVPPGQEAPRCLLRDSDARASSFHPFDKRRRNFVSDDHDAQDAIVAQQCRDAEPRRRDGWISRPHFGDSGGRSASHRGYQFEHG